MFVMSCPVRMSCLWQEKDMNVERVEELMAQLTHVELDNKH